MNSENAESTAPVERLVMRRFLKRCVRFGIDWISCIVGIGSVAIYISVWLSFIAWLFLEWNRPEVRITFYGAMLFLAMIVSGWKWFDDLREWSEDSDA